MTPSAVCQTVVLVGYCVLASCSQMDAATREYPKEMMDETKIDVLAEILTNSVSSARIAAARRLAEIGNTAAVPHLQTAYRTLGKAEPASTVMSRKTIVEALGRLQGKESRLALRAMLSALLETGPQYPHHIHEDLVFLTLGTALVRALGPAAWDTKVLEDLSKVMSDEKIPTAMRREACRWILQSQMRDAGLDTLEKKVVWLTSQLQSTGAGSRSDWVKGKSGVQTMRALTDTAIMKILRGFGPDARPVLERELAEIRDKHGPDHSNRKVEALVLLLRQIRPR